MSDLDFISDDARYALHLPGNVMQEILGHCAAAGRVETGGILIGEYTPAHDCALVHTATGPTSDSVATRTTFRRGVKGLQALLDKLWRHDRRYYLGEWHFHPGAAPDASGVDVDQLVEISSDLKYRCPEPLLLIVGGVLGGEWNASALVFPKGQSAIHLRSPK